VIASVYIILEHYSVAIFISIVIQRHKYTTVRGTLTYFGNEVSTFDSNLHRVWSLREVSI